MAAMASSSSETKQETMYYEELDALTVTTNILSPNGNNNNNQTATKSKKKPHGTQQMPEKSRGLPQVAEKRPFWDTGGTSRSTRIEPGAEKVVPGGRF